jgi:asparagine synthase (glutamine-hydrolysing)
MSEPVTIYADSLARKMSERVKVVLTGGAADEIFGGYSGYNQAVRSDQHRNRVQHIPAGLASLIPGRIGQRLARSVAAAHMPASQWRADGLNTATDIFLRRMCTDEFIAAWVDCKPGNYVKKDIDSSGTDSVLRASMLSDLMVCNQHSHSVIPDVAGMSSSLEYRSPFLDHRIIEFSGTVPSDMLVPSAKDSLKNKDIMKEYLSRYIPREMVYLPKMGFGYTIDLFKFMKTDWRFIVEHQLLSGKYLSLDVFSKKGAEWAMDHSLLSAWIVFCFSIWADMYIFNETPFDVAERFRSIQKVI